MADPIHRADPAYRRNALLLLGGSIVLGTVLLVWLRGWLEALYRDGGAALGLDVLPGLRLIFVALALSLILPLLALAAWLRREGERVQAGDRYPVAGSRTLRDIPVRTGAAAATMVLRCRRLTLVCLLLSVAVASWAAWAWLRY